MVRLDLIIFKTTMKQMKLRKDYAEKLSETTGIETQIRHLCSNSKLSKE